VATVAALLESRSALVTLRRSILRGGPRVASCRSPLALGQLFQTRVIEAIVAAPRIAADPGIGRVLQAYPHIPRLMYAAFRPDDGELLLGCNRDGALGVAVDGVDDAILGEMVGRLSLTAQRRRALAEAPRVLRLSEPLQLQVWDYLLINVTTPIRTAEVARRFRVSREHLSRQFGAGGAPNLKRVIDLTRVACAAQLLANAGYTAVTVAELLGFASSSHLSDTARRVAGVSAQGLPTIGARGVLAAFAKGKMRSRS
jgi:AraC-like DNA-binding protein